MSLVVVALGCVQKTLACKLPQHKTVINQIKQRDGRWKEGGKLLVNSRSKMWARQRAAGREEGKREQEMLRFPLDVRCVSVPDKLSLFPARCVWAAGEIEGGWVIWGSRDGQSWRHFYHHFFFSLWCRVFSQRSVFLTTLKERLFWLGGNLVVVLVFGSEVLVGGLQRSRCHVSSHPFTRGSAASAVSQSHLWASRVSGLCWGSWRFSAMLRCVIQRANSLTHSHPLASVTFRGKRLYPRFRHQV